MEREIDTGWIEQEFGGAGDGGSDGIGDGGSEFVGGGGCPEQQPGGCDDGGTSI